MAIRTVRYIGVKDAYSAKTYMHMHMHAGHAYIYKHLNMQLPIYVYVPLKLHARQPMLWVYHLAPPPHASRSPKTPGNTSYAIYAVVPPLHGPV
jgi:hypothetical protein